MSDILETVKKILFVDDDKNTLSFYQKVLGKNFDIDTALTAKEALDKIKMSETYAVIVSDMRMPEMDGIEFLSEVKNLSPDSVRIMLTANADIDTAVKVVNEGNIFRLLIKPCTPDLLTDTLNDAIYQHHLMTLEQKLNYILRQEIKLREKIEMDLREANAKLELMAREDMLTKLYNRRHLIELFESEFERARRYDTILSVLMMDIDFFKKINDTYGHLAGDEVLMKISEVIKKSIRQSDIAGRYGGEEFLILLPETSLERAGATAEKLRKNIEDVSINFEGKIFGVTCSIGVATSHPEIENMNTLLNQADHALYIAKETGRNRVIKPE